MTCFDVSLNAISYWIQILIVTCIIILCTYKRKTTTTINSDTPGRLRCFTNSDFWNVKKKYMLFQWNMKITLYVYTKYCKKPQSLQRFCKRVSLCFKNSTKTTFVNYLFVDKSFYLCPRKNPCWFLITWITV